MLRESTELHLIEKCPISETNSDKGYSQSNHEALEQEFRDKILQRKLDVTLHDADKLIKFLKENLKEFCEIADEDQMHQLFTALLNHIQNCCEQIRCHSGTSTSALETRLTNLTRDLLAFSTNAGLLSQGKFNSILKPFLSQERLKQLDILQTINNS